MKQGGGRPKKAKVVKSILVNAGVLTVAQLRRLDEEAISVYAVTGALTVAQLHSLGEDAQPVPVVVEVLTDGRIFVIPGTLTVAQLRSLDEEDQSACAAAGALTAGQLHSLGAAIARVPAVGGIPTAKRRVLLDAIAEVLPYYTKSGEAYRRRFAKKRGPRPKFHRAHLLIDCQRAWRRATGRREGLWVTQGGKASVPVQLANAVLPVVSRDRLSWSAWRSQCDVARWILSQMALA